MTGPWPALLAAAAVGVALRPRLPVPRRIDGPILPPPGWTDPRAGAQRWLAIVQRQRTAARRDAQLPDLLERIASGLRSGLALGPALVAAVPGAPLPLASELAPVAEALRHGAPLEGVLERWGSSPGASADVRLVAAALDLSRQAGGATSRAVDRVAATLRERRELQAEARTLATQARASAGVLAVAPLVFTVLVATIDPGAVTVLVTTALGAVCLILGLTLEAVGALWMARIVRSAW